jgi:hypothetical protein
MIRCESKGIAKIARITKDYKTDTALVVLVASTAAEGTGTWHLPITATKQKKKMALA